VDAPTKPFVDPAKATKLGDVFARLVAPRLETDYVRLVGEGDKVYVQTNEAWYTYRYLQTKIVKPDEIDVISPAPKSLIGSKEGGRYLTMTSCDPIYVNTNRIIVWFELEKIDLAGEPAPAAVKWLETK
jgi:hypothetical protein